MKNKKLIFEMFFQEISVVDLASELNVHPITITRARQNPEVISKDLKKKIAKKLRRRVSDLF